VHATRADLHAPVDVRRASAHPLVTGTRSCAGRPLHLAATKRAGLDVVAALLKAAPHVAGMVDHNVDYLPLHCAAQSGADLDVILALLQAHPEAAFARNKGGGTALHLAAWGKSTLAVVQALLRANPQAAGCADSAGWLPLHCAAANESAEQEVRPGDCAHGVGCRKRRGCSLQVTLHLHCAGHRGAAAGVPGCGNAQLARRAPTALGSKGEGRGGRGQRAPPSASRSCQDSRASRTVALAFGCRQERRAGRGDGPAKVVCSGDRHRE